MTNSTKKTFTIPKKGIYIIGGVCREFEEGEKVEVEEINARPIASVPDE